MKCKGGERWFIIKETPDFFELAEAEDTKN